jgi:site-specific DNA-cytosine methylase
MRLWSRKNKPPYNRNTVLSQCVTTNGGKRDWHPCGTRSFTIQELALLQGFDAGHLFAVTNKTTLRRQIGNAVALSVEKAILKEVIKSMRAFDRKVAAWRPEDDAMVLD